MNSENFEQKPLFKNKNIELLGKASVVKLGKDTLGFQLDGRDGGSGGEKGDISWIYPVGNKMKMVAGCHYEEWRFGPLGVECEPKINSSLKPTEAFYPIELNYKLVKYKLNDKAQSGSEEWDIKSIGNKKGKVVILFNPQTQTYELPVGFEKISTDANKLWEYFSSSAASKKISK
jgi:raw score 3.82